jgi:superfamily II DNA helicase RecQ
MERRNLEYKVIAKKKETLKQLVEYYLQKYSNGTGIIYCMTMLVLIYQIFN